MSYEDMVLDKIIIKLHEISISDVLEIKFTRDIFKSDFELNELDKYLKLNLVNYTEINDKEQIEILSKVIVKSISFLNRYCNDLLISEKLKIRWETFSEICSYYLEARSYKSSYEAVKRNESAILIIKNLYKSSCNITEIDNLFSHTKQYTSQLVSKLENLGIVNKKNIGQNTIVTLTSIGIDIYRECIRENEQKLEKLGKSISEKLPESSKIIPMHRNTPALAFNN